MSFGAPVDVGTRPHVCRGMPGDAFVGAVTAVYLVTECGQGPRSVYGEIMSVTTYPIRRKIMRWFGSLCSSDLNLLSFASFSALRGAILHLDTSNELRVQSKPRGREMGCASSNGLRVLHLLKLRGT